MHLLAIGLSLLALSATANTAPCEKAVTGKGWPGWRSDSVAAGPVRVRRDPLDAMSRIGSGLVTKMPILVEGRAPETVTVSVPPRLRGRAFLYYGAMRNRDGKPTTSFVDTRGYDETEFQLCEGKPRTVWPGGVRVKGDGPVSLEVSVAGRERPYVLHLGRPRLYRSPGER